MARVLKLKQTFRCPQALCDVSSRFISRNPEQIAKTVRSATPAVGPVLQAFQMNQREEVQDGVRQYLAKLHQQLLSGTVPQGRNGRVTVFVLGRYRADRSAMPSDWKAAFGSDGRRVDRPSIEGARGGLRDPAGHDQPQLPEPARG